MPSTMAMSVLTPAMTRLFQSDQHIAVPEQRRVIAELRRPLGNQTGGDLKISSGSLKETMNIQ